MYFFKLSFCVTIATGERVKHVVRLSYSLFRINYLAKKTTPFPLFHTPAFWYVSFQVFKKLFCFPPTGSPRRCLWGPRAQGSPLLGSIGHDKLW